MKISKDGLSFTKTRLKIASIEKKLQTNIGLKKLCPQKVFDILFFSFLEGAAIILLKAPF